MRLASEDRQESFKTEQKMLDVRTHRSKYLDLDILNLKEEVYNIEKRINHAKQRMHIFDLFNYVSASGHTLMSWAGAVGSGKATILACYKYM